MQDRRHRGALSNPANRYDQTRAEAIDDGWGHHPDEDLPPLRTTVIEDSSRSIITRNTSPDVPFDRSINPYRGCEHGCVYCFARPSHAWLGLSPGLDFETRLFAKPDAAALLDSELRKKTYACAPIAIGTNTDPYQPIERERRVMRQVLEVLSAFEHPVMITTKSALIERDAELLAQMAARDLVRVGISITTLDRDTARLLEPRASPPKARLRAIRTLARAGVPVRVMVAPIIPLLTDHEIERIMAAAAEAGARWAAHILLRLPLEVKELFAEWLETHHPGKAAHVLALVRQTRDGALYQAQFGTRLAGTGPYAEMIAQRARLAAAKLGLNGPDPGPDRGRFRPPPRPGDQLSLF
ncbi:MAG: PA0069 family radical SAM protein [Alphaproteobacteria bacterium]|nr:PA0069 family radical SAM protein [Alphaproteobacteria bacterium]